MHPIASPIAELEFESAALDRHLGLKSISILNLQTSCSAAFILAR